MNRKNSFQVSMYPQVFASNHYDDCGNVSSHFILCNGSADIFAGGKEFENRFFFYCYGLKIFNHSESKMYIGVKRLQFEFEGT